MSQSGLKMVVLLLLTVLMVAYPSAPQAEQRGPLGYQLFCLNNPEECRGGGAAKAGYNATLLSTLKTVNNIVNRSIRPVKDAGADIWSASARAGDCEDYVLAKRRALIKRGVPASALRIAYVKTRKDVGHAILVVKTSRGDFVLDNLNVAIRPLSQSGYRIVSMSGANPESWS